jgi:hypothetical protein
MDLDLAQARWVLGMIPLDQLPELAAQAMVQGFEGPGVLDLASFDEPTLHLIKPEIVEQAFREMGRAPLTRSQAALRVARELALRILRGQVSVEKGAADVFDLTRRCGFKEAPRELTRFESWMARFEDDRAVSSEYAQAVVEWAWEMANQEPGR